MEGAIITSMGIDGCEAHGEAHNHQQLMLGGYKALICHIASYLCRLSLFQLLSFILCDFNFRAFMISSFLCLYTTES